MELKKIEGLQIDLEQLKKLGFKDLLAKDADAEIIEKAIKNARRPLLRRTAKKLKIKKRKSLNLEELRGAILKKKNSSVISAYNKTLETRKAILTKAINLIKELVESRKPSSNS